MRRCFYCGHLSHCSKSPPKPLKHNTPTTTLALVNLSPLPPPGRLPPTPALLSLRSPPSGGSQRRAVSLSPHGGWGFSGAPPSLSSPPRPSLRSGHIGFPAPFRLPRARFIAPPLRIKTPSTAKAPLMVGRGVRPFSLRCAALEEPSPALLQPPSAAAPSFLARSRSAVSLCTVAFGQPGGFPKLFIVCVSPYAPVCPSALARSSTSRLASHFGRCLRRKESLKRTRSTRFFDPASLILWYVVQYFAF